MTALPSSLQLFRIRSVEYHCPRIRAGSKFQEKAFVKSSPCTLRLSKATYLVLSRELFPNSWSISLWNKIYSAQHTLLEAQNRSLHASWIIPPPMDMVVTIVKIRRLLTMRAFAATQGCPLLMKCVPSLFLMAFTLLGLESCLRLIRKNIFLREEKSWEKSRTYYIVTSYVRPLILWMSVILVCRNFDSVVLPSNTSQAIKERVVNFVRSLSTVLAFAFCTASLIQQVQKLVLERHGMEDGRKLGIQFIGSTIYTSVWVAAVCLFMELLGFSTQRWITAGGFGTVLVTLAGREIFTNFLSSIMIHATRPFVESEWIQTKIEGQEVSGIVEHVGWWSPTVIRGDDREAVHIPNHKFTVSVVRNLTQKVHWRIKAHLGISHLDFSKITYIVADMRKVLAKNPQVEHKRLHRRVFLENIDPENQALLILVSCFVKTSHFEEYLRVKEIILLDLLKVISHHNARLATPIRTIQRSYDESEARNAPFGSSASRSSGSSYGPFLLVGSSSSDPNEVHAKGMPSKNADRHVSGSEHASVSNGNAESSQDMKIKSKTKVGAAESTSKNSLAGQASKPQLEGLDSMGLHSNDITLLGAAFEKPPAKIPEGRLDSPSAEKSSPRVAPSEHNAQTLVVGEELLINAVETLERPEGDFSPDFQDPRFFSKSSMDVPSQVQTSKSTLNELQDDDPWKIQPLPSTLPPVSKQDNGHSFSRASPPVDTAANSSVARPQSVKENLVLGVALDGPKRTLPLDANVPTSTEQKGYAASRNGSGSTVTDKQEST